MYLLCTPLVVHRLKPILLCRYLQGKEAVPFLEKLVVGDVAGIENGAGSLTVFTNDKGGIIDDTVLTKVRMVKALPGWPLQRSRCTYDFHTP